MLTITRVKYAILSASKELSALIVGKHPLHFLVVSQMVEDMSALSTLYVDAALVTVQMAMANGPILESSVLESANDMESLLSRLLGLHLILLDPSISKLLGLYFTHLEAEVSYLHLSEWCECCRC